MNLLSFVLAALQAASTNILRRYLFPWVIFRDLIFPALWSLRGLRPAQPTIADAVRNIFISTPISAMILARGKSKQKALIAVARKLLVLIWNMLSKKEAFNPEYKRRIQAA
jgi:hypothetical protein